jgi:hypothetical protein
MSAPVRADAVLSRTETALGEAVARTSPTALGRQLGRAHSTISRDWQGDLARWPAADFMRLAAHDHTLRAEVVAALTGSPEVLPTCTTARAASDLVRSMAREIEALVERVSDGRLDAREGAVTDAELDALGAQISQLRGLIRAERRRGA